MLNAAPGQDGGPTTDVAQDGQEPPAATMTKDEHTPPDETTPADAHTQPEDHTTTAELTTTNRLETETVEPVVRVGLAILGLVALLLLGRVLPGADQPVLTEAVTIADLVVGVVTVGIATALVYGAPQVRTLLRAWLEGAPAVVESAAAIGAYLVYFVAILVAYSGLAGVIEPLLRPAWLYDGLFLVLGLAVLVAIASRYVRAMGPITGFLAERVSSDDRTAHAGEDESV